MRLALTGPGGAPLILLSLASFFQVVLAVLRYEHGVEDARRWDFQDTTASTTRQYTIRSMVPSERPAYTFIRL